MIPPPSDVRSRSFASVAPGLDVSNRQAYPGLYAPPHGYQWVQSGNAFLLVALACGLIANLLTR